MDSAAASFFLDGATAAHATVPDDDDQRLAWPKNDTPSSTSPGGCDITPPFARRRSIFPGRSPRRHQQLLQQQQQQQAQTASQLHAGAPHRWWKARGGAPLSVTPMPTPLPAPPAAAAAEVGVAAAILCAAPAAADVRAPTTVSADFSGLQNSGTQQGHGGVVPQAAAQPQPQQVVSRSDSALQGSRGAGLSPLRRAIQSSADVTSILSKLSIATSSVKKSPTRKRGQPAAIARPLLLTSPVVSETVDLSSSPAIALVNECLGRVDGIPPNLRARLEESLPLLIEDFDDHIIQEVKLCCNYLFSDYITPIEWDRARDWFRSTGNGADLRDLTSVGFDAFWEMRAAAPTTTPGICPIFPEIVTAYLKRVVKRIKGGLVPDPVREVICHIFSGYSFEDGSPQPPVEHLQLASALLRANPRREELTRTIARLCREILRRSPVEPRALAVVVPIHDLDGRTRYAAAIELRERHLREFAAMAAASVTASPAATGGGRFTWKSFWSSGRGSKGGAQSPTAVAAASLSAAAMADARDLVDLRVGAERVSDTDRERLMRETDTWNRFWGRVMVDYELFL
ncbi:hypothetical protein HK405_008680 [Cladochytrium tenue]|nr:hypothetical protein HK405_008680 [Cladochytrium tenue]